MTGKEMQLLRKGLGMTQKRFAKEFGLNLRSVQNWEIDRYKIFSNVADAVRSRFLELSEKT